MFKELQDLISREGADAWTGVYQLLEAGGCLDPEYLRNTSEGNVAEAVKRADRMDIDEVYTWLTWILRGERFSDGLFETSIENGTLSRLLQRGYELEQERV